MRMNVDNYRCILSKSGLNDAEVCKRTGLTEKSIEANRRNLLKAQTAGNENQ